MIQGHQRLPNLLIRVQFGLVPGLVDVQTTGEVGPQTLKVRRVLTTHAFDLISDRCDVFFGGEVDRKSTRLNSSHRCISYAVFCLKKKMREHLSPDNLC